MFNFFTKFFEATARKAEQQDFDAGFDYAAGRLLRKPHERGLMPYEMRLTTNNAFEKGVTAALAAFDKVAKYKEERWGFNR